TYDGGMALPPVPHVGHGAGAGGAGPGAGPACASPTCEDGLGGRAENTTEAPFPLSDGSGSNCSPVSCSFMEFPPTVSACENHPPIHRRGTPLAPSTGLDAHRISDALHSLTQSDLVIGDEAREPHSVGS